MAGKREIVLRLPAAVLLSDNVLNMKREAAMLLFQSAILTTVLSTLPHEFPQSHVHSNPIAYGTRERSCWALCCRIEIKSSAFTRAS